jgi:hypothetical protein
MIGLETRLLPLLQQEEEENKRITKDCASVLIVKCGTTLLCQADNKNRILVKGQPQNNKRITVAPRCV